MGMVCENCGWRVNPNNNTGKGCMFSNTKRKWDLLNYNKPCGNYITDTELKAHLIKLLGIDKPTNETEATP